MNRTVCQAGQVLALALALIAAFGVGAGVMAAVPAQSLRVGSLQLHRCQTTAPWCGSLQRPLDPRGVLPGTISIYFEFYPHSGAAPATGTLVATEGGPGYPATETRDAYLAFFAPLRATRDVVIMDNRGTGRSGAVDCRPLQTDPALTEENVAACGHTLGNKAITYSAGYSSDDLEAILAALGAGPIDLYGDSYGTFFEQVFAVRHPGRLRSIIFDGAYPLNGPDYAWYPNYAPSMRDKFNLACERSEDCRRIPGSSLDHIGPALAALRREPFKAQARDSNGELRSFTANATSLGIVMFGSAPSFATLRETDAAARAYTDGDREPLLRLMAETQVGTDSRDAAQKPARFSAGLAAAVMCQDAPQIFDMRLDPDTRVKLRDAAIAGRRSTAPQTYAPFTIDEYRSMPLDYAFIDECARWPAVPQPVVDTVHVTYPDVPALIISGDLDNMTPTADGTMLTRHLRRGRQIIVPNGFHVNALPHARSACPARIARRFIENLDPGDTSCLAGIPEVRLMPRFARRVDELAPASALPGNAAAAAGLRLVSAAVLTVADVIDRVESNSSGTGPGLRGGRFSTAERTNGRRITLENVQWTNDLAVSGNIDWPGQSGPAVADLQVHGPSSLSGTLQVHWTEGIARARAQVKGRLNGVTVAAATVAP